jgi:hypothetical protein
MLRTLFHNGWSHAKIRSNQGYVGKVRAPARARSRARKLGYARGSLLEFDLSPDFSHFF